MDMTKMKNSKMPPEAVEQMKAMGMDSMVVISRPDKKSSYMIYPGLKAYAEMPLKEANSPEAIEKFKMETTKISEEKVDGHPCVKNKVVVTDDKDKKQEFTVWNATDLKSFPVKLEMLERGTTVTMSFTEVKLAKPEAKLFEAPSDLKRYDNMMTLMQEEMMKKMGGGGFGVQPGRIVDQLGLVQHLMPLPQLRHCAPNCKRNLRDVAQGSYPILRHQRFGS